MNLAAQPDAGWSPPPPRPLSQDLYQQLKAESCDMESTAFIQVGMLCTA